MNTMTKPRMIIAAAALAAAVFGCSGELTDNGSPVELVVTNSQTISQLDLLPGATGCTGTIGEIKMQVIPKNSSVGGNFVQVRVTRYRVSYQRTDGGRSVPFSFVRSTDQLIGVGATASLSQFLILEGDALTQAPFAALLPENGGRDPDTGRPVVKMDVIVELFGETLGCDRVFDATRFPLDFCFNCGGCS